MKKEIGSDDKITFTFNPRTEKTGVTLETSYYVMLFGKLSILDYGGRHIKIRKSTESTYVADLFGITSIFVYCDIVQPQIVGDTSVPLLRTVAKPGSCVWSCKMFASAEGASHLGGSGGILPRKIFEISTPKIAIFSNLSILKF